MTTASAIEPRQLDDAHQEPADNDDDVPVQLRRRREAAERLPPLDCGRRDPWSTR